MANYGNNTMRLQDDREAMRTYPNNYVGSDDINGVFQTLKEILSNAVDEANAGFGKEVNIKINKNNEISIEDFGRGLPMAYNSVEKLYNWEIALCRLHGGGKFKDDRSSYNSSSGQHGIGAAATQLSSEFMDVISKRDGYEYVMHFEKGLPVGKLEKTKLSDKATGTKITWKPDIEVFTEIEIPLEMITEWLRLQAIVNKGLKINFTDERHDVEEVFYYEKGIEEYAEQKNNLSEVIYFEVEGAGQDTPTRPIYEVKGELVFAVTENPETMYFHNTIPLEYGGSPNKAMEAAFLEFFNHVDKFKDLTVDDITQNLLFISSTYTVIPPSFENQTKKAISNKFIQDFLTNQILIKLQEWKKTNPLDFETLLKRVKVNNESRKSAALHRELKKKKLTENISGIKTRIDNYVDCRSKDTGQRELYICEGLSALSSLKQARDADYQALLPIRGKILSTMKASPSRVLENKLLKDITNLIGVGINSKSTKVNMDNLNFNKIIMACFTGDTKVATLNGDLTFNELIGRDDVWVYAKDIDGNTVTTKAYNIQKIKDVNKLVKITLNNGEEIKSTLDHNFMLTNRSYKEAKDLSIGEELMTHKHIEEHNLKVVNKEFIYLERPEPVYCLTADTYHNFALSAGVFVKNCDADLDAYHIIALMLTFFYNFMPELLLEGKVYSLVTPLFEITYKDGTKAFAYTEEERAKLVKPGCKVSRNKGLGEVNADIMAKCLHKDTQHLIQYTLEDGKLADEYMKLFMDTDVEPRKEYIIDNMNKYEVDIAEL